MKKNPSFVSYSWRNDLLHEDIKSPYPTRVYALVDDMTFHFREGSTYFLYQYAGMSVVGAQHTLLPGMYAVCTHKNEYVYGDCGTKTLIIERIGTDAPYLLGGPIEQTGRLNYIDGCTDSLLLAPWKYGEPCLNHLHFPEYINQTPHTHPSLRVGVVAKGSGQCITPFGNIPLNTGDIFVILPENGNLMPGSAEMGLANKEFLEGTHSFQTHDSSMDVIAYHPDSDFGPKHEEHPMINRTIVNGTSAKDIEEIRSNVIPHIS